VACGFLANCRGDGIFKDDSPSPSFTNYSSNFAASFPTDSDPPPNDSFCSPENLGTITTLANANPLSSQNFTNLRATVETGEPSPGAGSEEYKSCLSQDGWCEDDPGVQNSVWYQFDVDVNSDASFVDIIWSHTSSPDLQFALYKTTGSCSERTLNFTEVAANDGIDRMKRDLAPLIIYAPVSAGNTYLIQVDGFKGTIFSGGYINVLAIFAPPNDSFCSPENLGTITTLVNANPLSSQSFTNYGATVQNGEPSPGAGSVEYSSCSSQDGWCEDDLGVQNSVWYQFDVDVNSDALFVDIIWSHPSYPDFQFALYMTTGSCSERTLNFTKVAANDDNIGLFKDDPTPQIKNAAVSAGNTYLLQVDGFDGARYNMGIITVRAANLPPSWGLDRVNQCQLPLDDIPTKQTATGVKVFFIGDGMEGDHEELRDMINPDDDCHFSPVSGDRRGADPLIDDWG
jgi:hypothetical protein